MLAHIFSAFFLPHAIKALPDLFVRVHVSAPLVTIVTSGFTASFLWCPEIKCGPGHPRPSRDTRYAQKVMQHIFFSFTIDFIKTSNMSHHYMNLWLPKPIFQCSLLLNLWPYATEMREHVCLRGTTLQVSVATTSLLQQ
jgi:hypothetical protein